MSGRRRTTTADHPYSCYLEHDSDAGGKKYAFVAVLFNVTRGKYGCWYSDGFLGQRKTPWEKEYHGRSGSEFGGVRDANAYARAIVKNKIENDWHRVWSRDESTTPPPTTEYRHDPPDWWEFVEKGVDRYTPAGARLPKAAPAPSTIRREAFGGEEPASFVTEKLDGAKTVTPVGGPVARSKQLNAFKQKMEELKAKVKVGEHVITLKGTSEPAKAEPVKEEVKRVIQPRFGYRPIAK